MPRPDRKYGSVRRKKRKFTKQSKIGHSTCIPTSAIFTDMPKVLDVWSLHGAENEDAEMSRMETLVDDRSTGSARPDPQQLKEVESDDDHSLGSLSPMISNVVEAVNFGALFPEEESENEDLKCSASFSSAGRQSWEDKGVASCSAPHKVSEKNENSGKFCNARSNSASPVDLKPSVFENNNGVFPDTFKSSASSQSEEDKVEWCFQDVKVEIEDESLACNELERAHFQSWDAHDTGPSQSFLSGFVKIEPKTEDDISEYRDDLQPQEYLQSYNHIYQPSMPSTSQETVPVLSMPKAPHSKFVVKSKDHPRRLVRPVQRRDDSPTVDTVTCLVCNASCSVTENRKIPSLPFCKKCKKAYFYQLSQKKSTEKKVCNEGGNCKIDYRQQRICPRCHHAKFRRVLETAEKVFKQPFRLKHTLMRVSSKKWKQDWFEIREKMLMHEALTNQPVVMLDRVNDDMLTSQRLQVCGYHQSLLGWKPHDLDISWREQSTSTESHPVTGPSSRSSPHNVKVKKVLQAIDPLCAESEVDNVGSEGATHFKLLKALMHMKKIPTAARRNRKKLKKKKGKRLLSKKSRAGTSHVVAAKSNSHQNGSLECCAGHSNSSDRVTNNSGHVTSKSPGGSKKHAESLLKRKNSLSRSVRTKLDNYVHKKIKCSETAKRRSEDTNSIKLCVLSCGHVCSKCNSEQTFKWLEDHGYNMKYPSDAKCTEQLEQEVERSSVDNVIFKKLWEINQLVKRKNRSYFSHKNGIIMFKSLALKASESAGVSRSCENLAPVTNKTMVISRSSEPAEAALHPVMVFSSFADRDHAQSVQQSAGSRSPAQQTQAASKFPQSAGQTAGAELFTESEQRIVMSRPFIKYLQETAVSRPFTQLLLQAAVSTTFTQPLQKPAASTFTQPLQKPATSTTFTQLLQKPTASTTFSQSLQKPAASSFTQPLQKPTASTTFTQSLQKPTASTTFTQSLQKPTASTTFTQSLQKPTASTTFTQSLQKPTASTTFTQSLQKPTASTTFTQSLQKPTASTTFTQSLQKPTASTTFTQSLQKPTASTTFTQSLRKPTTFTQPLQKLTASTTFTQSLQKPTTSFTQSLQKPTASTLLQTAVSTTFTQSLQKPASTFTQSLQKPTAFTQSLQKTAVSTTNSTPSFMPVFPVTTTLVQPRLPSVVSGPLEPYIIPVVSTISSETVSPVKLISVVNLLKSANPSTANAVNVLPSSLVSPVPATSSAHSVVAGHDQVVSSELPLASPDAPRVLSGTQMRLPVILASCLKVKTQPSGLPQPP